MEQPTSQWSLAKPLNETTTMVNNLQLHEKFTTLSCWETLPEPNCHILDPMSEKTQRGGPSPWDAQDHDYRSLRQDIQNWPIVSPSFQDYPGIALFRLKPGLINSVWFGLLHLWRIPNNWGSNTYRMHPSTWQPMFLEDSNGASPYFILRVLGYFAL